MFTLFALFDILLLMKFVVSLIYRMMEKSYKNQSVVVIT